jgi:uncharacterized protein
MSVEPPVQIGKDERMWGMLCHLSALSGLITGAGFILGPLIVWLIKKDEYPFANEQGKESVNFQISMIIYSFISGLLMLIVIGVLMLVAIGIMEIVFVIMASLAANEGKPYRYPLTIRFIK